MLVDTLPLIRRNKQIGGIYYYYNTTFSKWLSTDKSIYEFGLNHVNVGESRWLAVTDGITSNNNGYFISRKSTILDITITSKTVAVVDFDLYYDGTIIRSVNLSGLTFKENDLNIDIEEDGVLRMFINKVNSGRLGYPIVSVVLCCRL